MAADTSLYLPVAQSDGAVEPAAQKLPAGHAAQSACAVLPVSLEKLPAAHSVGATDPAGQKPPAVHCSQAVSPVPPWKRPAVHGVHSAALPLSLYEPAAHGVCAVEPVAHEEPAGQTWQSDCAVLPVSPE